MKLFNIFAIALVQANPLEKADKPGIATAAFDEKTPNIGKIGCGKGTIIITQVCSYSSNLLHLTKKLLKGTLEGPKEPRMQIRCHQESERYLQKSELV